MNDLFWNGYHKLITFVRHIKLQLCQLIIGNHEMGSLSFFLIKSCYKEQQSVIFNMRCVSLAFYYWLSIQFIYLIDDLKINYRMHTLLNAFQCAKYVQEIVFKIPLYQLHIDLS